MKKIFTCMVVALFSLSLAMATDMPKMQTKQNQEKQISRQKNRVENATPASRSVVSRAIADYDYAEITIPYSQNHSFTIDGEHHRLKVVPLKFTLTETTFLSFLGYNNDLDWGAVCDLYDSEYNYIRSLLWFDGYGLSLEAGTYYLLLNDDCLYWDYDEVFTCDIQINIIDQVISFRDVNYSQKIEADVPAAGVILSDAGNVGDAGMVAPAVGYSFAAEAGKHYQFTYAVYAPQLLQLRSAISLLSGTIGSSTASYYDVCVDYNYGYNDGTKVDLNLYYSSFKTEDLNILLQANGNDELVYSFTVSEMSADANALTLSQLLDATTTTIPYSSTLSYTDLGVLGSTETSLVMGLRAEYESYYAKAYKISLAQGNTIRIHESSSADAYLYLYKKVAEDYILVDSNDDYDANNLDSYIRFTAETEADAGDYYIVASSLRNSFEGGVGLFYLTVWNTADDSTPSLGLTLPQLLDATTTTISYSNNLSYTDNGVFSESGASLVTDDGSIYFRGIGGAYYTKAYKITLAQHDVIKIHHSLFAGDAFLFIYKKDGNGYVCVDYDDDGYGGGLDSYIEYSAESDGDYYIVICPINSQQTGAYYLTVWNTASEPANSYIGLLQSIASLQSIACPVRSLSILPNTTDAEIRVKLLELKLTGTVAVDGKQIDLPLENHPYAWTIAANGQSATYTPTENNQYTIDNNVSYTVTLNRPGVVPPLPIDIDTATSEVKVYAYEGTIYVIDAGIGNSVSISNAMGQLQYKGRIDSEYQQFLIANPGIYIVHVGNQVFKVISK